MRIRNLIGIHALVDTKTTVTGMCAVDLDEWPILRGGRSARLRSRHRTILNVPGVAA